MRILLPICLVGLTCVALLTSAAEDNLQRVRFREVDTLFANPGQGWMSQQRNPNGRTRFPLLGRLHPIRLDGRRAAGGPVQLEVH
jgi:hypothetical protein